MSYARRLGIRNMPLWFHGTSHTCFPVDRRWASVVARRIRRLPLWSHIARGPGRPMTRAGRNHQARAAIAVLLGVKHRRAHA